MNSWSQSYTECEELLNVTKVLLFMDIGIWKMYLIWQQNTIPTSVHIYTHTHLLTYLEHAHNLEKNNNYTQTYFLHTYPEQKDIYCRVGKYLIDCLLDYWLLWINERRFGNATSGSVLLISVSVFSAFQVSTTENKCLTYPLRIGCLCEDAVRLSVTILSVLEQV